MKKIYFFLCMLLCSAGAWAQTTYTWNQTGTAAWTTTTNWTPTRTTPATNDILVFDNGATTTITAVPTQTIGQLSVTSSTTVNLQGAGAGTILTIAGGTGTDLSVANGSALNINVATNTTTITLGAGATGSISGNMTFTSAAHKLTATDASAVTFQTGSIFTAGTGFTSNAFGTTSLNSIIFANGSTYVQAAGSNPFGPAAPNSVVVFQSGSLYKITANLAPSFSGRTYANLEINFATFSQSGTGGNPLTVDNLIISDGTLNLNLTGGINIKGNISVATGEILTFTPASANSLNFNGSSAQSINNSGTLTFAANATVSIANASGVTFNNNQTIAGDLNLSSGVLNDGGNTISVAGNITGTGSHSGAGKIVMTGSAKTISGASLQNIELNNAGGFALTGSPAVNGTLTLTAGSLALGANNLSIAAISGGSPTSYIKTNGAGAVTVNNIGLETLVPLGNAKYNPVTIQNGSGHNWAVRVEDGVIADPGFPTDKAVLVTWNITPSVNPPAGPANITFQFDEATQAGANFSVGENVQAWYRTSFWNAAGSPASAVGLAGAKKVTVSGLTHFSPYAISNITGPLPITIDYFNGAKQGSDHLLSWKVNCSSTPSATMILERSPDGRNYKEIYSITATAARCQQPFDYTSTQPLAGFNYYRLKMLDANGKISYSSTVALLNKQSGFELISIAPNPVMANGKAILNVTAAEAGTLQIIVTDMNGSKLMTQTENLQAGSKQVIMNLGKLSIGTYQVTAFYSDGTKKTLRFVKQ